MIIRALEQADLPKIREIHEKFYKEEFSLPNFLDKYLSVFVVEDETDIITIGGIRPIIESVALTNKEASARKRREALIKLLQASEWTCKQYGFSEIHAFIQDPNWCEQLKKHGFKLAKGNMLTLGVL